MISENLPPIICRQDDAVNLKAAVAETGLSEKTLRRYFKKYRLGRQAGPNSAIWISRPGLQMVLHGDFDALAHLRANERSHPDVARYFEDLGIPL